MATYRRNECLTSKLNSISTKLDRETEGNFRMVSTNWAAGNERDNQTPKEVGLRDWLFGWYQNQIYSTCEQPIKSLALIGIVWPWLKFWILF